jgi:peptidoglycan hydrolase-like protein with peptidoglycan-binding domain
MVYELLWLPVVLRDAGLKVALTDGWESRGRAHMGTIAGVICHHTAGPKQGNMPSLNLLIEGRSDLAGPLAQLGLGRDGTFYVIAAGRCNHAGAGTWQGITSGNTNFIGIEAENAGVAGDPWPDVQLDAYARGVAAILSHVKHGAQACAGHKEYALPPGRKTDPNFDMSEFRAKVQGFMTGTATPRPMIPAQEPTGQGQNRPTLRRNATGDLVRSIQVKLHIPDNGTFDADVEASVRQFQREHSLVPDGIVGPKTWIALDAA